MQSSKAHGLLDSTSKPPSTETLRAVSALSPQKILKQGPRDLGTGKIICMPYISRFITKQLSKHLQDKVIFKSAELHVDSIQVCSHFKRGQATEETEASKESRETRANDERRREVRRVSLTMGSSHKGLNVQKQRPCMKNGQMM